MSYRVRLLVAAMVLGGAGAALAQDASARLSADPLRPLVACPFGNGLETRNVARWPANTPSRTVQTATGPREVSVADGYRMLLAFPGTAPFVNLKLERSQPGRLAADRAAILAQMTGFAAGAAGGVVPLKVIERDGIEIMALNNPTIDGGGVISIYTLISENDDLIATAYVLNAKPAQRKFQTYQQYEALRNDFIYALALCMAEL